MLTDVIDVIANTYLILKMFTTPINGKMCRRHVRQALTDEILKSHIQLKCPVTREEILACVENTCAYQVIPLRLQQNMGYTPDGPILGSQFPPIGSMFVCSRSRRVAMEDVAANVRLTTDAMAERLE